MKCYSQEELVAFAENPLCESNAAIASHVFVCPECAREFREILDTLQPSTECTREELQSVRNFLARRLDRRSLWDKLRELVASFTLLPDSSAFDLLPGGAFASTNSADAFASTADATSSSRVDSYAASPSKGRGRRAARSAGNAVPITIVFGAKCDHADPFYWRAELELPTAPTATTELRITLTDNLDEKIPFGTLVLFGSHLQVRDGNATIQYNVFCEGLSNPSVQFIFLNGKISDGDLIFL